MCPYFGTPKKFILQLEQMENLLLLRVPILKHITVVVLKWKILLFKGIMPLKDTDEKALSVDRPSDVFSVFSMKYFAVRKFYAYNGSRKIALSACKIIHELHV